MVSYIIIAKFFAPPQSLLNFSFIATGERRGFIMPQIGDIKVFNLAILIQLSSAVHSTKKFLYARNTYLSAFALLLVLYL